LSASRTLARAVCLDVLVVEPKTMLAPITPAIAHSRGELNLARRSDDALSRVQRCVAPHL
jgi:hypothetical protein